MKLIIRFEDGDWSCSREVTVTPKDLQAHSYDVTEALAYPVIQEILPDVRARLRSQWTVPETDRDLK